MVRLTIYSNTAEYGEKMGKIAYFHLFEALNGTFEVQ